MKNLLKSISNRYCSTLRKNWEAARKTQKQSLNDEKHEYLVSLRVEIVERAGARLDTPDIRPNTEETWQELD